MRGRAEESEETVSQKEILPAPYPPVFRRQKSTVGRRDTMGVGPTDSEDKLRCICCGDRETTNYLKMMIDGYLSFFLPLTLPTYH